MMYLFGKKHKTVASITAKLHETIAGLETQPVSTDSLGLRHSSAV